jgi:hypothetical protein
VPARGDRGVLRGNGAIRYFNRHHPIWAANGHQGQDLEAEGLIDIISNSQLELLLAEDTITHEKAGNQTTTVLACGAPWLTDRLTSFVLCYKAMAHKEQSRNMEIIVHFYMKNEVHSQSIWTSRRSYGLLCLIGKNNSINFPLRYNNARPRTIGGSGTTTSL